MCVLHSVCTPCGISGYWSKWDVTIILSYWKQLCIPLHAGKHITPKWLGQHKLEDSQSKSVTHIQHVSSPKIFVCSMQHYTQLHTDHPPHTASLALRYHVLANLITAPMHRGAGALNCKRCIAWSGPYYLQRSLGVHCYHGDHIHYKVLNPRQLHLLTIAHLIKCDMSAD